MTLKDLILKSSSTLRTDGWMVSRHWGQVKICEMKFEYESKVQETTLNLAADDFVEAILEDALVGKADYVPKY